MSSTHPNLLIIGAMKAGTTLLWDVLDQHPEVFMSRPKEPHFFAVQAASPYEPCLEGDTNPVRELVEYQALFQHADGAKVVGEASTSYLHTVGAAELIHAQLPHAKIICVLRNPIQRAYSHYLFLTRLGVENAGDFAQALSLEANRIRDRAAFGRYLEISSYYRHLQPYSRLFDGGQIHICLFEDLIRPAEQSYYPTIFRFLGINEGFRPDTSIVRNPSGVPKRRWVEFFFSRENPLRRFLQPLLPRSLYRFATALRDRNLSKPSIPPEVQQELQEFFREDIDRLEQVLGRDLSGWRIP